MERIMSISYRKRIRKLSKAAKLGASAAVVVDHNDADSSLVESTKWINEVDIALRRAAFRIKIGTRILAGEGRRTALPIARVMKVFQSKYKGVSYEKDVLSILNQKANRKFKESIYSSLRSIFNQLEDEVNQVLLLCGVLGPSISVSNLLKYVFGLGVFKLVDSIEDARSKLDRIIGDLEKYLLLHYSGREVKVPDLICDVVSFIASKHHNVFTRNACSLKDWTGEGVLASCTKIILKRCNIQTLPQTLDCPDLEFLYLDNINDDGTLAIPDSFFGGTRNLQVLVLIGVPLSAKSLVSLDKLKTLCLNQCRLQEMVGIGALKSLEILSFFQSSMEEFPREIEQLARLTSLELQIPEASILPCSMRFDKLKEFNIVIGDQWKWSDSNGTSRLLKLKLHPNNHLKQDQIKALVASAQDMYLEIDGLEQIWLDPSVAVDQVFEKLKTIKVNRCDRPEYLFLASTIEKLSKLVEIEVSNCSSMKNIVLLDSGTTIDEIESIPVHSLTLQHLPLMNGCCRNDLPHHIPTLFPNEKALFRSLKHLKLISVSRIKLLVITALSNGMVPLQDLETMEIEDCYDLKYLFVIKGLNMHENYGGLLPHLCLLRLRNLGELRSIVGLNHPGGTLSFKMLKRLTVCNCNQLIYVLPLYVIENLQQLENIQISDCEMLERIFGDEEDKQMRKSDNTVHQLTQVKSLILEKLPKFSGCCQDGFKVEWLSLKRVKVVKCDMIQKELLGMIERPLLTSVEVIECKTWATANNDDPETNIMHLFSLTGQFSTREDVKIKDSEELKTYVEKKLQLPKLKTVEALKCDNELTKYLSTLLNQSYKLENLKVRNCELLEQVLDLTEFVSNKESHLKFPNLKTMQLDNLPKLNCIWNKDPRGILGLGKLTKLEIIKCGLPKSPLTAPLVKELVSLEVLKIESCENIEFVVEDDKEEEISFGKLKDLHLASLQKLIKFNTRNCNFKFPNLLCLTIDECPELNAFTTGFLIKTTNEGTSSEMPSDEKMDVCSKLEKLKLVGNESFEEIWQSKVSHIPECELKEIEVDSFSSLTYIFPSSMLQMMSEKLKKLVVRNCKSLSHLFEPGRSVSIKAFVNLKILTVEGCGSLKRLLLTSNYPNLTDVNISNCDNLQGIFIDQNIKAEDKCFPNLKSIVLENLPVLSSFYLSPKLQKARIVKCPSIKALSRDVSEKADNSIDTDSIKAFENLQILTVKGCGSLKRLLLPSSYPNLTDIDISDCENLQEVFFKAEEKCFPNLKSIVLENLPMLSSFYLSPKLQKVRIVNCPTVKTLSKNVSDKVDNSVDTDSIKAFENLQILTVKGCGSLECMLLPSSYPNLTDIDISDCENLQEIFIKAEEKCFPNLKSIVLENLPVLSSFYSFPKLQKARVVNCPTIKTLSRNVSDKADNSINTNSSKIRSSGCGPGKMKLQNLKPQIRAFQKLTSLDIVGCKSIENLFSISVAQDLSSLKLLTLYECENMVQVLRRDEREETNINKLVFEKLETLVLKHLPKLTSFCEDLYFVEFPELKMVRVENIPNMETFVKKSLNTPKLKQVHVTPITKCWNQNLNKTIHLLHKNHDTLKRDVWEPDPSEKEKESDPSSAALHTDDAESSSQILQAPILDDSDLLIKEAETELDHA